MIFIFVLLVFRGYRVGCWGAASAAVGRAVEVLRGCLGGRVF